MLVFRKPIEGIDRPQMEADVVIVAIGEPPGAEMRNDIDDL